MDDIQSSALNAEGAEYSVTHTHCAWPSLNSKPKTANAAGSRAESVSPEMPTVLLVEDEPVILLTLGELLRHEGVQVIEAFDAEAAISLISAGTPVDVVLTDVRFPTGSDGFSFVRWLREQQTGARVIVTSGQVKRNEAIQQLEAPEAFIAKPYDAMTVATRLATLAKQKSAQH